MSKTNSSIKPVPRYIYLLLGIIVAAIVGQIAFGYFTAMSWIDLSSGGLAGWPQYGRDQEGTRYTPPRPGWRYPCSGR